MGYAPHDSAAANVLVRMRRILRANVADAGIASLSGLMTQRAVSHREHGRPPFDANPTAARCVPLVTALSHEAVVCHRPRVAAR